MHTRNAFNKMLLHIGIRLAELRIQKGYPTLKEFVQHYDLPEIQYWRMEKGKANITLKSLMKILKIHNITLQEFFCMLSVNQPAA